jgi:hypothetical protein
MSRAQKRRWARLKGQPDPHIAQTVPANGATFGIYLYVHEHEVRLTLSEARRLKTDLDALFAQEVP